PVHVAVGSALIQPIAASRDMSTDIKNILMMINKLTGVITTTFATLVELKDLICKVTELRKQILDLCFKVDDQENCARRNNVRLVGFPEGVERGRPIKFLQETLPELLKLPSSSALEVERAHRSLASKLAEGQRPHPFIVRFLRYPVREQVLTAARSLGTLEWNGSRILVFPDLSRDLMEQRRRFMPIKKALREKGLKYGLLYLATLKLTCEGETRSFTEP
uniref:L1 transposable element RRM domain-containing protein n=1 Tax=Latimeria chalumnae TaxID=7897 RepID=H3AV25_LATCH